MVGSFGCCARAASGHAAAALPRSVMKLRRLMQNCPSRTKPTKGQRCASQQNWTANDRYGSFATETAEPAQPLISGSVSKAEVKSQHRCVSRCANSGLLHRSNDGPAWR